MVTRLVAEGARGQQQPGGHRGDHLEGRLHIGHLVSLRDPARGEERARSTPGEALHQSGLRHREPQELVAGQQALRDRVVVGARDGATGAATATATADRHLGAAGAVGGVGAVSANGWAGHGEESAALSAAQGGGGGPFGNVREDDLRRCAHLRVGGWLLVVCPVDSM